MKKHLQALMFMLLTPVLCHGNALDESESVRAGVMYLISHKSEIELSRGHFGTFTKKTDNQVEVRFSEKLNGAETYSDTLAVDKQEQRRITHGLFAYNRKEFELDEIKEKYSQFFSDREPQCQNAFFPYTVCLVNELISSHLLLE